MKKKIAQLDHEGFFLHEAYAYGRGLPGNARENFPPDEPLPDQYRWRWIGSGYEATPDYRGKTVYRPDGTTHHPTEWGPLPDGHSLTAPPPPPPTHAEALATAYSRIQGARDARMNEGGLIWEGWLVSIDKEATDRMTSKAVQFQAGSLQVVRWKMSDGEYAELYQAGFFAMAEAAGMVVEMCYRVEESKRAAVEALPDAPAVLAWIDNPANLLTGWPDEYGQL